MLQYFRGKIVQKLYQILLGAFLCNCCLLVTHDSKSITPEVSVYYDKFVGFAKECRIPINNATLRIEMSTDIKKEYIAVCSYVENIITVNAKIWERLTETEREQTIFHELGHCLLDQRHDDSNLNVMNTIGFIVEMNYSKYYNYFMRTLFKGCKKEIYKHFEYKENK